MLPSERFTLLRLFYARLDPTAPDSLLLSISRDAGTNEGRASHQPPVVPDTVEDMRRRTLNCCVALLLAAAAACAFGQTGDRALPGQNAPRLGAEPAGSCLTLELAPPKTGQTLNIRLDGGPEACTIDGERCVATCRGAAS